MNRIERKKKKKKKKKKKMKKKKKKKKKKKNNNNNTCNNRSKAYQRCRLRGSGTDSSAIMHLLSRPEDSLSQVFDHHQQ